MRIRTQLILAAFVLAVVPLAAIVTYSYHSSRRALEAAYKREADRLTQQMDRRLATIRTDLDQRLEFVSALPLPQNAQGGADVGNIVTVMGDAASFVDALDFEPVRDATNTQVEVPEPAEAETPSQVAEAPEVPAEPAEPGQEPVPAPPPPPIAPVVIDLPPITAMPRYVMSEEQRELIGEIGRLGARLGTGQLTPEERQDVREELHEAQEELRRVVEADRSRYDAQMQQAMATRREHDRAMAELRKARIATATAPAAVAAKPPAQAPKKVVVRGATAKDLQKAAEDAKKSALILGRKFHAPVLHQGQVVGNITARISPEHVIRRILGSVVDDRSEIPFAVDREGTLYTRNEEERARLEALGVAARASRKQSMKGIDGWLVSMSTDAQSGLRIGVARPVGENLDELRRTAARNFGLGLGLIAFALIGIVPLSNHLTRDVALVTEGAERIAHGDLMTRLPVKTNNELGQLAKAFNRMAEDLSLQQQQLVEQERARREQEVQQRLMHVEYERKTEELEEARRFQLSMLPKEVPRHRLYDVAVFTRTATEVGGDYYDFHLIGDELTVTIGDATGHGAKAGTMVTVIKTLFAGFGGTTSPAEFLNDAAEKIKRMDLGRMAMALSLARFHKHSLTVASAGMPPVLVYRTATAAVDEIALQATPLGTLSTDYPQTEVKLAAGDTVLFLSDGFPELMNDAGQQLGYGAAYAAFAAAAVAPNAEGVIAALADAARKWHGDAPPNDDVTFVVVRV
ncbi:MAG TPA: SpoIIE family protein phosphatase [Thermoanaerobaculia bacterium]|nr:SpoIIE family protein phosphatase [Thermoanaerobaculia bacterium]